MLIAPLIQDLTIILGVAAIITYIFKLIKQPVVLGYILAGIIVGPYTPPILSIVDTESVKTWAELGVIFIMFSLGLDFSLRKLVKLGSTAGLVGVFEILVMVGLGYFLAKIFGWSGFNAIFLGCMISISSTTIIIKTFEELKFKGKKFVDLTFAILIIEDLAAIIMLVLLTNFATSSFVKPLELVFTIGKLFSVIGIWILFGILIVPRLVKRIAREGNDEMLTIATISLCLTLVTLAAYLGYSVALGAFIMGSILSESGQIKRIEKLVAPLKNIFGAVFFVSVGMLLNPLVIINNFSHVLLVTLIIISGKIIAVSFGCLLTGQSIKTSISTGFSMAQIGEFSFIIATLGQTLGVINNEIYPIVVASSFITTFTTPYLMKYSLGFSRFIEKLVPAKMALEMALYRAWFHRQSIVSNTVKKQVILQIGRFFVSAAIVGTLFFLSSRYLFNWINSIFGLNDWSKLIAWSITIISTSPFIWGMVNIFKQKDNLYLTSSKIKKVYYNILQLLSYLIVVAFVAILSAEFFSGWISLVFFIVFFLVLLFIFKVKLKIISVELEKRFFDSFEHSESQANLKLTAEKLIPWEAHLSTIEVFSQSQIVGKTLQELKLREEYGVNLIAINRDYTQIIAPNALERIFPHDELLCFASDMEIEHFKSILVQSMLSDTIENTNNHFVLKQLLVPSGSCISCKTIKNSSIYAIYNCSVVGIERDGLQIKSPRATEIIADGDILWIIGDSKRLQALIDAVLYANILEKK